MASSVATLLSHPNVRTGEGVLQKIEAAAEAIKKNGQESLMVSYWTGACQ